MSSMLRIDRTDKARLEQLADHLGLSLKQTFQQCLTALEYLETKRILSNKELLSNLPQKIQTEMKDDILLILLGIGDQYRRIQKRNYKKLMKR